MSTQVISTMSRPMTTLMLVFSWACRVVAAIILLQTLFFKFTAAPESTIPVATPAAAAVVPEPASLASVAGALSIFAFAMRRRR